MNRYVPLLSLCMLVVSALFVSLHSAERPLIVPQADGSLTADGSLKADGSVVWGQLDNGMIYAIMPNNEPKDKISLRLFVRVGSLQEEDNEQGLAHYLEHMGFNGSESFPEANQVIETLQGIGVAFGRDSNAHTGFDETVYKLDMPNTKTETIDLGLQVFSDWAAKLHNADKEVDDERGIILSEMRDRAGPQMRIWQGLYQQAFAGLQLGYRFPIGTEESIKSIPAERIRAFYKKWYRPERMVLTVVGRIDVKDIEQRIHKYFASIEKSTAAIVHPHYGALQESDAINYYALHEKEYAGTFLYYSVSQTQQWLPDGEQRRLRGLCQRIVASIMNRRLQAYVEDNSDGPILSGSLSFSGRYAVDQVSAHVSPKPGKILQAIPVLEQELRRMREFGPTQQELDIAIKGIHAALKQSLANKANRKNSSLASSLYSSVKNATVFQTPEQRNALTVQLLGKINLQQLQMTIDRAFNTGRHFFGLFGRDTVDVAVMQQAYENSEKIPLEKQSDEVVAQWAYADVADLKQPLADIAKITTLDHGIISIACANHVHAAILPRDEKPNQIMMRIRIAVDQLPQQVGVSEAMGAYMDGGLAAHSAKELRSVLAGKRANVWVSAGASSFTIGGSCPPEELELMLQMARAWIMHGGWRKEGFDRLRTEWFESLDAQRTDLEAVFSKRLSLLTSGGLTHLRTASLDEAKAVRWQDVQAWARPVFAQGAMELSIVGDVDAEKCTQLIGKYFATLPQRQEIKIINDLTAEGAMKALAPLVAGNYRCEVDASVSRAMIRVIWPTDDAGDVKFARRMGHLSRVLNDLLRTNVREKLGDAYSPYARHSASTEYDKKGQMFMQVSIAPERVDQVVPVLRQVITDLLREGISNDLFNRVHTPALSSLPTYRQGNNYWMNSVVSRCHSQPQRLQWASKMMADMSAITKDELVALAKKYLTAEPLIVIAVSEGHEKAAVEVEGEKK